MVAWQFSLSIIGERYIKGISEGNLSEITETLVFKLVRVRTKAKRKVAPKGGRTVEEAVQILWKVIDEAKMYMEDPMLTPEEKRRWAKTLADTIGVLNKLLASQGEKQLEDEDLGSLLTRVPLTLRMAVVRRARIWRRKNS